MDPEVWNDPKQPPEDFKPERWLAQPDAPLFTYGLGYRMCAGSLLANRELYLVFMRTLSAFEITKGTDVDVHPVKGSADPTSLVTIPRRYEVYFKPRNVKVLERELQKREGLLAAADK